MWIVKACMFQRDKDTAKEGGIFIETRNHAGTISERIIDLNGEIVENPLFWYQLYEHRLCVPISFEMTNLRH